MNVGELIEELRKLPQHIDVVYWDHDEDEWVTVVEAIKEAGTPHVALNHVKGDWIQGDEPED